jgi:hypothetical protein
MNFLAPALLGGAAAASVPVIIHLFFRSRYRPQEWAAMEFLRRAVQKTSRRLKFQELLLLLLRMLLLVLLAVALARPFTTNENVIVPEGEPVEALFLFDQSYSMGAQEAGTTRFEQAKAKAKLIVDRLPVGSKVQLIGFNTTAQLIGSPESREVAKASIDKLRLTYQATNLASATGLAVKLLGANQPAASPGEQVVRPPAGLTELQYKHIYLISDMQRSGFDQGGQSVRGDLQALRKRGPLFFVRVGSTTPRNAAVVGIAPQTELPVVGRRMVFTVFVRNSGKEPLRDVRVWLAVDGNRQNREETAIAELAAEETRAVNLTTQFSRPGQAIISAGIESDDLAADNRFDAVVDVREKVRIVVVDGRPNDQLPSESASFFLGHALLSVPAAQRSTYPLDVQVIRPAQVTSTMLEDREIDMFILADVALDGRNRPAAGKLTADFADRLTSYVRGGGTLVILPGEALLPRKDANPYTDAFGTPSKRKLLPMDIVGIERLVIDPTAKVDPIVKDGDEKAKAGSKNQPAFFDLTSIDDKSFLARFREKQFEGLGRVEVLTRLKLAEPKKTEQDPDVRVVMRYTDGEPAVVSRPVGEGQVLLWTVPFDMTWSALPSLPTFPPLVKLMYTQLLQQGTKQQNRVVGDELRVPLRVGDSSLSFRLESPDDRVPGGKSESQLKRPAPKFGEEVAAPELVVPGTKTLLPGVYRIYAGNQTQPIRHGTFALVPDLSESIDLESLSDAQIDDALGFSPVHLKLQDSTDETQGVALADAVRSEWTITLLLILLGLVCVETLYAWFCGRSL